MDHRANFLALILLDALEDENESDVRTILEKNNVNPSYVPRERGIAPLHYACGMENERLALEFTRMFLAKGADVNVRSEENMTPLHVAVINGRKEVVKLLLEYGAIVHLVDHERKTPTHYAIEDCNFDIVQIIRNHVYQAKKQRQKGVEENKRQQNEQLSKNKDAITSQYLETGNEKPTIGDSVNNKSTPNRLQYSFDATSPYYINITHRRHKPQPVYPDDAADRVTQNEQQINETNKRYHIEEKDANSDMDAEERESTNIHDSSTRCVNLFSLTKENLRELTQFTAATDRSRSSLIEIWREKVQRSRARQCIVKQFDNIEEMVNNVMENDHLNFTNTEIKEVAENGVDAISSSADAAAAQQKKRTQNVSLGTLIQKISRVNFADIKPEPEYEPELATVPETGPDTDGSYTTAYGPMNDGNSSRTGRPQKEARKSDLKANENSPPTNFIRSPDMRDYYLQLTEAYVHTDDENGMVFYETKLPSNHGNRVAYKRQTENRRLKGGQSDDDHIATDLESTISTNMTIPLDYETDQLRAELTTFGEQPGPITKSTKRLYIHRLIKMKRKTAFMQELRKKMNLETKFSVELHRTLRSVENFELVSNYMRFELESRNYFAQHPQKKKMREGHLKQSFIYMLIDPRISNNLPGESVFLDKFDVWKRFLESVFYVGKGKTTRPYSHLYEAMKIHSKIQSPAIAEQIYGKKVSVKKLNADVFKSPLKNSTDSKKLDRILDIWANASGVVCLHVFHNIVPADAYTREAAMIDALSLRHLTNIKRGDYYGPAQSWTMKEKKYFGIALLYKAMQMYLAEGESQLAPCDLI